MCKSFKCLYELRAKSKTKIQYIKVFSFYFQVSYGTLSVPRSSCASPLHTKPLCLFDNKRSFQTGVRFYLLDLLSILCNLLGNQLEGIIEKIYY